MGADLNREDDSRRTSLLDLRCASTYSEYKDDGHTSFCYSSKLKQSFATLYYFVTVGFTVICCQKMSY